MQHIKEGTFGIAYCYIVNHVHYDKYVKLNTSMDLYFNKNVTKIGKSIWAHVFGLYKSDYILQNVIKEMLAKIHPQPIEDFITVIDKDGWLFFFQQKKLYQKKIFLSFKLPFD